MKKTILFSILACLTFLTSSSAYGEYVQFDIKYGMHEKIVNQKYGDPISVKNIKVHPIPIKKALYKIDEPNYMILHFFSGRIYKIILLEDMEPEDAAEIFEGD